jgi:1-acyl-sn-glycerol-3-phosphate acyltransferase
VGPLSETLTRDAEFVRSLMPLLWRYVKTWHRSEVRGLDQVPAGASLVVSNHSGGLLAMDFPVFAVDFADHFGVERPLYLLTHGVLYDTPLAGPVLRAGLVPASRKTAQTVLRSGATLMVFPGGDYDAGRPGSCANLIDFRGRTGYVKTALQADVPIVPTVSIGGHENQLYLSRGETLVRLLKLEQRTRVSILPLTFGFPWGLSLGFLLPPNLPLPTKIVTQVLEPVDVRAEFGDDPDPRVVDAQIRKLMQSALDELARNRRFPVIG